MQLACDHAIGEAKMSVDIPGPSRARTKWFRAPKLAFAESGDAACEVENNSEALRRSNERKHRSEKSEGESVGLNTRSSSRPNALAIRFVLGVIFNGNDVEVRTVTNRSP
jgi:hypothetical protein